MRIPRMNPVMTFAIVAAALLVAPGASAHCDTMSGPVVSAARQALETGNVNLVLVWVQPTDDAAIRQEFEKARAGRAAGGEARAAAETRFLEALVRIHRAGEGAPYTGIKPEGTDIGLAVPAADRALESGSSAELQTLVGDAVHAGIQKHFEEALERRRYDPNDVAAGRTYVRAYVEYTHFIEGVYEAATRPAHHEHAEGHADAHAGGHAGHVPWLLAGLLGLALAVETGWLVARKRS